MPAVVIKEQHYNSAPITNAAVTNVNPLAVVPAALADTAGRVETNTALQALEADVLVLATKVNLLLEALRTGGAVAR